MNFLRTFRIRASHLPRLHSPRWFSKFNHIEQDDPVLTRTPNLKNPAVQPSPDSPSSIPSPSDFGTPFIPDRPTIPSTPIPPVDFIAQVNAMNISSLPVETTDSKPFHSALVTRRKPSNRSSPDRTLQPSGHEPVRGRLTQMQLLRLVTTHTTAPRTYDVERLTSVFQVNADTLADMLHHLSVPFVHTSATERMMIGTREFPQFLGTVTENGAVVTLGMHLVDRIPQQMAKEEERLLKTQEAKS